MIQAYGIGAEANPVVEHVLAESGLPLADVAKVAALALAVAVAVVLSVAGIGAATLVWRARWSRSRSSPV
jgi:hypothetical protein